MKEKVLVADEYDSFQLVVVVVAGTQRHDKVAQTDERRVDGCENAHDHVTNERVLLRRVEHAALEALRVRPVKHARRVEALF